MNFCSKEIEKRCEKSIYRKILHELFPQITLGYLKDSTINSHWINDFPMDSFLWKIFWKSWRNLNILNFNKLIEAFYWVLKLWLDYKAIIFLLYHPSLVTHCFKRLTTLQHFYIVKKIIRNVDTQNKEKWNRGYWLKKWKAKKRINRSYFPLEIWFHEIMNMVLWLTVIVSYS